MLSKLNPSDFEKRTFSDLKNEAEKRNLRLPHHPTKKQIIQILTDQKSPKNDHEFIFPSDCSSTSSLHKEKKAISHPKKYYNSVNSIKKIPDVIVIPPEQFMETQNHIFSKHEHSPVLPAHNYENRNNTRQIVTNQNLIDKKAIYSKNIFMILFIVLCTLVLANPYLFILAILCILGMIFSDSVAKLIMILENIIKYFHTKDKL